EFLDQFIATAVGQSILGQPPGTGSKDKVRYRIQDFVGAWRHFENCSSAMRGCSAVYTVII
ncbi:hypothetical protein, partial [Endozoicomonas sp. YOMI1]|uniref:hypothetical protein n=1 Tax=Endozoicomonas sp. YOMI1 TaxID=2828739 RepID=UPI0021485409